MTTERSYTDFSGYTKHYFAGTERLASAIGNGGLADIGIVGSEGLMDKRMERDTLLHRVMEPYPLRINRNRLDTLYGMTRSDTTAELTYFFHPDHLGSASWITDLSGQPVQHLQYKPFGGDYINQQAPNTDYSERFRFTGKERDAETGYDYFGARYYSSSLGIWLSVDPMSDKYPSLSPYVCCADNPMRLVDIEGQEWVNAHSEKVNKLKTAYDKNPTKELYRQLKAEIKKESRVNTYLNELKKNDIHLYNYIENLKVSDKSGNYSNVKVSVFSASYYKGASDEVANTFFQLKGDYVIYNGEAILAPSASLGEPSFDVTIFGNTSFGDSRLANEIGDIMFFMEYNEEAVKEKGNYNMSDTEYRHSKTGVYSFMVEKKYKERKNSPNKSLENIYPLNIEMK